MEAFFHSVTNISPGASGRIRCLPQELTAASARHNFHPDSQERPERIVLLIAGKRMTLTCKDFVGLGLAGRRLRRLFDASMIVITIKQRSVDEASAIVADMDAS